MFVNETATQILAITISLFPLSPRPPSFQPDILLKIQRRPFMFFWGFLVSLLWLFGVFMGKLVSSGDFFVMGERGRGGGFLVSSGAIFVSSVASGCLVFSVFGHIALIIV